MNGFFRDFFRAIYPDPNDSGHGAWLTRFLLGLLVPPGLLIYGIVCIVTRHAILPGSRISMTLTDTNAILMGAALIGAACNLHVINIWPHSERFCNWAAPVIIVTALAALVPFLTMVVRICMMG